MSFSPPTPQGRGAAVALPSFLWAEDGRPDLRADRSSDLQDVVALVALVDGSHASPVIVHHDPNALAPLVGG
jgi:hypothetical protein